jgi:hypothetical protein
MKRRAHGNRRPVDLVLISAQAKGAVARLVYIRPENS